VVTPQTHRPHPTTPEKPADKQQISKDIDPTHWEGQRRLKRMGQKNKFVVEGGQKRLVFGWSKFAVGKILILCATNTRKSPCHYPLSPPPPSFLLLLSNYSTPLLSSSNETMPVSSLALPSARTPNRPSLQASTSHRPQWGQGSPVRGREIWYMHPKVQQSFCCVLVV